MRMIEYDCKRCTKLFYIPRYNNPFKSNRTKNEAKHCPYCGSTELWNVTLMQEQKAIPEGAN